MTSQAFRKKERIKNNKEIGRVLKFGKKYKLREVITIFVLPNNLSYSRLGIAINREIKKASVRNKLKRLAREVFRKNKHILKVPIDIVILFKDIIGYKDMEDFFIKILK